MFLAVAAHPRLEVLAQRVDDTRAHAVEATRGDVGAAVELRAGMQLGEDDLESGLAGLRVPVHGNAAAVVLDHHAAQVAGQGHADGGRIAIDDVNGVVDDLPHEMVEPSLPVPPMYMPGRLRTGSRPSRATMDEAS